MTRDNLPQPNCDSAGKAENKCRTKNVGLANLSPV